MMIPKEYINLPNLLSCSRLVIAPFVLPILIVYLLPYQYPLCNIAITILFLGFSFTDFLDGFFARKYRCTTTFGATIDHIADKLLTSSVFIGLLTIGKIYFMWVILFIGRDFFVMGLRQLALEHSFSVPVGFLGKCKTALQMLLISWIIINPALFFAASPALEYAYISILTITLYTTLASAWHYFLEFLTALQTQIERQPYQKLIP